VAGIQQRWESAPPPAPAAPSAPRTSDSGAATARAPAPHDTLGARSGSRSVHSRASDAAQEVRAEKLLRRMIGSFADELAVAARMRGVSAMAGADAERMAEALIAMPEQKRVLWVDDKPEGNRHEIAALAKLQIEVVTVTSTEEALARLDGDAEGFDLVVSDWDRPEALDGTPSAGLKLLRALAARPQRPPVVFYHGAFDPALRSGRHDTLLQAGAFGEAVAPGELLALVQTALKSS
ncbi:MAG: response regulator, partial [Thauera sp.]